MAIVFTCACGQRYSVDESLAGKSVRCKKCGATSILPRPIPEEEAGPEVVAEPASAAPPATPRPAEAAADEDREADERDGPRYFQGYISPFNGSPRDCRVYRVGDELLLVDAGKHVLDNHNAAVRVGASTGGLIGGLIGLGAAAVLKKVGDYHKDQAKRRQRDLDRMSAEELVREADAGKPSWRCSLADVTGAALLPPSLLGDPTVIAVLHLQTAERGKTAKTRIWFERFRDVKEAAGLLREALGEEKVNVRVPLKKKAHARAEARRQRNRRIVQWSIGGAALVGVAVLLLVLFLQGKLGGHAGNAGGDGHPGAPAGFAVVEAPVDAPPANGGAARRREHHRLVQGLAEEAPPFDPAHAPTTRSTFAHLAALGGVPEPVIEAADKRLNGGPPSSKADEARFVDDLLRGQGGPPRAGAAGPPKDVWAPIPIDKPSAPLKLAFPGGLPLEPHRGGPYHLGALNGPFHVPFPSWINHRPPGRPFDLLRDPKNRNRYVLKVTTPLASHPVIDLRDGKPVGEFDWQAPVWANPRLSPDGSYLVGPDGLTTLDIILTSTISNWENGKGLLYIWARGKKTPATLKVPGDVVDWMEFVGNDRLAYVTYAPNAVLRIHDVARNQPVAEVELTGARPAAYPDRTHDETPVWPSLEFYRPMARRGAVSANGKYVALGCQDGVRLVSVAEGKVVGLLPVADAKWYRWLNFSPDGSRLFGFVIAGTRHGDHCFFRSWSVATGRPLEELALDPYVTGPIFAGPVEGLYVANKFFFTRNPLPLEDAPYRILRLEDDGTALVVGTRAQAPADTPPPESLRERIKAKQAPPADADRKDIQFALFTTKLDWTKPVEKVRPVLALLAPRPAATAGDRAGVTAQKPEPPAAWAPPSFAAAPAPPEEGDDPAAMHQFGAWPVSFGDDRAAVVRYVPNLEHRKRWEVWLDLVDRTTGKRAAPGAKLWDWAQFPEDLGTVPGRQGDYGAMTTRPLPPIAALRPDAGLFALVDPNDAHRVDVFRPSGERVLGLLPAADRRTDWLGWSRTHLLTVAGGRLTAWDPSSGKAVYEVDGGYTHVGAVSPDHQWVVLWAGTHADLLDAATGRCLGRCQAGGFSGRLEAFTLSPDGRRLAAAFTGWPTADPAPGPGYTAVVWNLETGKAALHGFAGDTSPRPAAPICTCVWAGTEHLLLAGRPFTEPATLLDARLGRVVGTFKLQIGGYVADQPAAGSPDGRLWFPTTAVVGAPKDFNPYTTHHPDFPGRFVWHTASLPGLHGKDAFLADPAREWLDSSAQPVRVEAALGTAAQGESLARSIARAVQGQGLQVGPGGTTLRVEGVLEDSNDTVTFTFGAEVKVPRCVLSGRWLSPQGTELWKGKTTLAWSPAASKYKVSEKSEFLGPNASVRRYEFDFKGRSPSSAMREELIDNLAGGSGAAWVELPDVQFLRAQGQDRPMPLTGTMVVRTPPGVK